MENVNAAPHQAFQRKHADDLWSSAATDQLRRYLEEGLGTRFEFPELECRQDLCEIQAATVNRASNDDAADFQHVINSMPQQPWWQTLGFGAPTISLKSGSDGGSYLSASLLVSPRSTARGIIESPARRSGCS